MTVRSPQFQWIGDFEEAGPPGDPGILLVGKALLGGSPHVVKAVRVRPDERLPDYRSGVSAAEYRELALEALLEELEIITGTIEPERVTLDSGRYVICVIPSEHPE